MIWLTLWLNEGVIISIELMLSLQAPDLKEILSNSERYGQLHQGLDLFSQVRVLNGLKWDELLSKRFPKLELCLNI